MLGITTTNARVGGFRGKGIDADATTIYNRIIADGGVSNLTRLNFFVKGLKTIYGSLTNVPVCYDAHWIGYKLGSGTGATAGQAAAKLYSLTVAGDAVQTTAASQPLLLAHNGVDNYYWNNGVESSGNNSVTTPNASANQITGDIEIIAKVNLDQHNSASTNWIISKRLGAASGIGYELVLENRTIIFLFSINGTSLITATTAFQVTVGTDIFIKANRVASTGVVNILTSTDGITYTSRLNTTLTSGNIFNSTEILRVGTMWNQALPFGGKIYRATISNSIGGTPVVDFNPATYNAATSQTNWTSATGEVWTINTGTATTGYKGVLVDRTIVQGDGVDDVISVAISGNAIRTQYIAHKSLGSSSGFVGGLFLTAVFAQAFSYNSNKYNFYQQGAFDGPFGAVVIGTTNRALRISGAVGGTGTDWIPFQNGIDVSNAGANIGLAISYNILTLFSRGNITSFDNAIFNTYIMSSGADNLTIRTATQAFAKTLNNNI